ncbi:MAG: hypothetical protein ABJN26_23835 [Stappiaceae bacterium]
MRIADAAVPLTLSIHWLIVYLYAHQSHLAALLGKWHPVEIQGSNIIRTNNLFQFVAGMETGFALVHPYERKTTSYLHAGIKTDFELTNTWIQLRYLSNEP